MLVPPDNFGLVEPGVYRCLKLEADHVPFIETLQLKSLVLLDAAKPPRTLREFLEEKQVELFNLGGLKILSHLRGLSSSDKKEEELEPVLLDKGKANDAWMLIESSMMAAAFEVIFNKTKHPTLIVDSSLTLVGILRKIQKWNFNSIVNEFRIYTGDSSKNNYNAQNFFELIQLHLVPYEVEPRRKSLAKAPSPRIKPEEKSDEPDQDHEEAVDDVSLDDFEDEVDEDLLLALPQIPANLLKLVEERKHDGKELPEKLPTQRPHRHPSVNENLYLNAPQQPRKLSTDSKFLRSNCTKFRNPSFSGLSISPGRRPSLEASLRYFRLNSDKSELKPKEKFNYRYYCAQDPVHMKGVDVLRLRLPAEDKLPDWFVSGRNYWESLFGRKE